MPLSDADARNALPREKPYKLTDRDGLYLFVQPTGARYWRRNYTFKGKQKTAAIGVYWTQEIAAAPDDATKKRPVMSLAKAREEVARQRALIRQGVDPADEKVVIAEKARQEAQEARQARRAAIDAAVARRKAEKAQRATARATFRKVADEWMAEAEPGWTDQHARQVRQSLRDHVEPSIGSMPITDIGTDDIDKLLAAMLNKAKIETARRVRQRLSAIWEFAVLRKYTDRDPVTPIGRRFRASQKQALKANPRQNFAAVARHELPQLLRAMRSYAGDETTRTAMWLLALTFTRTTELRLATWSEFDLEAEAPTWTVPVERMKVKVRGDQKAGSHLVPLSRQAAALLVGLKARTGNGTLVFPQSRDLLKPISENAILHAISAIGFKGKMTGHGFRAVASTLLHEAHWADGAIEAQLAHEKADAVVAAYDRSQHLDTRRRMMQAYADMLDAIEKETAAGSNVVPMRAAA